MTKNYDAELGMLSLSEEYIHKDNSVCGEKSLWRAVVCRAMYDVHNLPSKLAERMECDHSVAWLLGRSKDFLMACDLADLDSAIVRLSVERQIKSKHSGHVTKEPGKPRSIKVC